MPRSRLHCEVDGSGPPLLLLHGFTGAGTAWPSALRGDLARDHRLLVPDLPGHGRSPAPPTADGHGLDRTVELLLDSLDRAGVEAPVWIGYSMGGRVALSAAVRHPARVASLVLESASPGLDDPGKRAERLEADLKLASRLRTRGIAEFVDEWLAQPLFTTQGSLPEAVQAEERSRRLRQDPGALADALELLSVGAQPSYWDDLDRVERPTLLLTGAEDRKFQRVARRMMDRLPRARHVEVEEAGHAIHLERPDRWLAEVRRFLGETTATRAGSH